MNPLSTSRNKYHSNVKDSTVFTPPGVCQFIFDKAVKPLMEEYEKEWIGTNPFKILDPAIGTGNLCKPIQNYFARPTFHITGYDIDDWNPRPCDVFYQENFMASSQSVISPHLIICNPPFNTDHRNKTWLKQNKKGKALLPEVFADRVFKLYQGTPFIMITPMGFLFNQRKKSDRWKKYAKDDLNTISSILMLPLDAFAGVEFHCCVVCFNFPEGMLRPFYWFEEAYL